MSFSCAPGSLTVIEGVSGSGKSTLLDIVGALDSDYDGVVAVAGRRISGAPASGLDECRRFSLGFVFQDFNLIEHLTVLRNVQVGCEIRGMAVDVSELRAMRALERAGVADLADRVPSGLSGGERQRVAIARALAKSPSVLLCDEPTGSLDSSTARQIANLFRALADDGTCVVVVTHDLRLFDGLADQVVSLLEGKAQVASNGARAHAGAVSPASPFDSRSEAPAGSVPPKRMGLRAFMGCVIGHMRASGGKIAVAVCIAFVGMMGFGLLASLLTGANDYSTDLQNRLLTSIPVVVSRDASPRAVASEDDGLEAGGLICGDGSWQELESRLVLPERANALQQVATSLDQYASRHEDVLSVQEIYPYWNDLYVKQGDSWRFVSEQTLLEEIGENFGEGGDAAAAVVRLLPDSNAMFRALPSDREAVLSDKYEVTYGRLPQSADEIVLVTQPDGRLGDALIALLGFSSYGAGGDAGGGVVDAIEADRFLGAEFALVEACDYLVRCGSDWVDARELDGKLEAALEEATQLHIVGIVRPRYVLEGSYDTGYLGYMPRLLTSLAEHCEGTQSARAQRASSSENIRTKEEFSVSYGLAREILGRANTSSLSKGQRAYLESLSDNRVRALLREAGIDEMSSSTELDGALAQWLEEVRDLDDAELVGRVESIAPQTLDEDLDQALADMNVFGPDDMDEVRVYVKSLAARRGVIDFVAHFNDLRRENGLAEVSVSPAPELDAFEQVSAIVVLVVAVLALLSAVVIVSNMSSIMGTFARERRREVGILRSLGMGARGVVMLFLTEAVLIGLAASALGLAGTAIVDIALNGFVEQLAGISTLFTLGAGAAAIAATAGVGLCVLASCAPSAKAAATDPARVLRTAEV